MAELKSVPLFELLVQFPDRDERQVIGDGGRGQRWVAPAASGTFEGAFLSGNVMPPWPDYLVRRPDGVTEHEIRAVLKTHDGALIYMHYDGIGHALDLGPLGGVEGTRYFRTRARFETGSPQYVWLNRIMAVADAHSAGPGTLAWSVHAIV